MYCEGSTESVKFDNFISVESINDVNQPIVLDKDIIGLRRGVLAERLRQVRRNFYRLFRVCKIVHPHTTAVPGCEDQGSQWFFMKLMRPEAPALARMDAVEFTENKDGHGINPVWVRDIEYP